MEAELDPRAPGWKFIVAYLHRLGGFLEARAPSYHVRSEAVPITIRNHEHRLIQLRSLREAGRKLQNNNITLHAGSDTWNEPGLCCASWCRTLWTREERMK